MPVDSNTRSDSPMQYWHEGAAILRDCLAKAERGDMFDAPMPLTGDQAALWHKAQASAYRHALEMMSPPEADPHFEMLVDQQWLDRRQDDPDEDVEAGSRPASPDPLCHHCRDRDAGQDRDHNEWSMTSGIVRASFFGDWNCWPMHLPRHYSGRVSLQTSYGGQGIRHDWQFLESGEEACEYAERLNALIYNKAPGFHWRRGFFFNVAPDGFVEIIRRPSPQHFPVLHARISPEEWRSIVRATTPEQTP